MFGIAIAKLPPNHGIWKRICPMVTAVRNLNIVGGKPPELAKNLEQRLKCKFCFEVRFSSWYF